MGSRNEDRSFSTMGASGVAIAPHIRDALEQARLAARESEAPREPLMEAPSFPKPASETARDAEDLRRALERANAVEGDLSRALLKVSSSGRRESSLVNRLAEKEKQVRDLRAYVHDALRLRDKAHAYLRASHLDPAVGLEMELLAAGGGGGAPPPPVEADPTVDELRAALAASELARDQLKADNASLAQQLREAKEWNDNLEREREDLYHLLDEAKSGNGAAMETS